MGSRIFSFNIERILIDKFIRIEVIYAIIEFGRIRVGL
jgi:hypothetical protein